MDTLAEHLKRFKPGEYPVGPYAKRFNDHGTVGRVD